jgi:pimeloyl-ACP methyl ester carboxylesterase
LGWFLLSILNQQIIRHKRDRIYEKLAKPGKDYSVYNNKHYQGEIILGEYRVERVFQDKRSGFYALGLVAISGENPPVLVIRGFGNWGRLEEFPTEFVPYKDIPDVVRTESDRHFQAAKTVGVIEWLREKAIEGIKPDIVGQSLGGKIGQQLTVEVPDNIHSLVTFNSIGISSKDFERYRGNVEIFHYINPADLVPYVLGDKFLPGTVFQVSNQSLRNHDLLGQHNNLLLDNPITLIKEVEINTFYFARELYQSLKDYGEIIQKEVEVLRKIAKQEITEYSEKKSISGEAIWQQFDSSRQTIHQVFRQIKQAIAQDFLEDIDRQRSVQLIKARIANSVKVIQQEVESLSQTVQQKIKGSDKPFKPFSQILQQEHKDSVGGLQQKLDNL